MKTSVITTLIENIARLQEFIPEKDMLVDRVVQNIMVNLRKQSSAVKKFSNEEKVVGKMMGVDSSIDILVSSPETVQLLTVVGNAVLAYYDHADAMGQLGDAKTLQ